MCHFSFKWSTHPNLNFGAKNRHSNLYYLPFFQFSSLTCWSWGSMLGSQVEGLEFDSWSDQRPFFPKICKKGGKIQIALIISLEREVAYQTGNFFWPLYRKNSLNDYKNQHLSRKPVSLQWPARIILVVKNWFIFLHWEVIEIIFLNIKSYEMVKYCKNQRLCRKPQSQWYDLREFFSRSKIHELKQYSKTKTMLPHV